MNCICAPITICYISVYDTFKNDLSTTGDWAAMKVTATKLTELAKQLDMFGYLSIQLTDDANFIKPDELTSSNIAIFIIFTYSSELAATL